VLLPYSAPDAGLGHLKGLTTLRDLNLKRTGVTDEGVNDLKQALSKCWIAYNSK
jgi:hypothetical protein